ncbi:MAG TPA: serine/threonine-protein kinase [Vicinamibacteria bacterium]|nr:serine/threonine-protein kinase [Vicinamibacteria bacterium]
MKGPGASEEETSARTSSSGTAASPGSSFSSSLREPAALASGSVVAGRYRIVRLLGRGGMGEVYLVHDLTLDQEVALKFLPAALARDPMRLALFHNEVRVARRVTHKNACRMYDIGEVEGRPFLSMEYVDGEDLASLLRRIGHLPEEKGLEVARQLAAGLAAAHEEGIVHRDLKPANVMIDGSGQVRIMDFGLAGVIGEIEDLRSGTPAYQAPEQIRGDDVSARTDLYSLGLILYEVFTGRRAFEEPSSPRELSAVKLPSSSRAIAVETERAVLRCLEPRPEDRPASALELAAMLPGADPLADALAAGKTPSPELVAAAGERRAIPAPKAFAGVGAIALGLMGFVALRAPRLLLAELPELKPPAVLVDRAETLVAKLGIEAFPHTGFGFRTDDAPPVLRFWFRGSSTPLETFGLNDRVSVRDPPMNESGMARIELDPAGRLVELVRVPGPSVLAATDWSVLFEAAELDSESFVPAEPDWIPPVFAEQRFSWKGPDSSTRVEAGSLAGAPVYFRVDDAASFTATKSSADEENTALSRLLSFAATGIGLAVLVGVTLLARRHWKGGRADRRGAARLAAAMFAVNAAGLVLGLEHYADPTRELNRWLEVLLEATFAAVVFWVFYLALEPFARRIWPHGLIAWNRLLGGQGRDPLVGRDVLIGVLAGVAMAATVPLADTLATTMGQPRTPPELPSPGVLLGSRYVASAILTWTTFAVNNTVLFLFLFVVSRFFVGRTWAAAGLTLAVVAILVAAQAGEFLSWLQTLLAIAIAIGTMVRFGFLAIVVAGMVDFALRSTPITDDWSEWYAGATLTMLSFLVALTLYGLVVSRRGVKGVI